MPLLALWGERNGVTNGIYDTLAEWREVAEDVRGRAVACGHYLAEEAPEATLAELRAFLDA